MFPHHKEANRLLDEQSECVPFCAGLDEMPSDILQQLKENHSAAVKQEASTGVSPCRPRCVRSHAGSKRE